jgi:DNA-binding NarL/FixJ family response regulator
MIQLVPLRLMCHLHCRMCFDSLRLCCDAHSEFQMTAPATEGVCELATIVEHRPDILVLDLDLPSDVLRLAAQVRHQATFVRVVVMRAKWSDLLLSKAITTGVHGVLHKSEPIEDLLEHFRHVARGETRISADLLGRLRYDTLKQQYVLTSGGILTSLSGQQLEILQLLACGDSLKMVASKLKLSKKSIDGHKYRLMRKLGVKDRVLLSRLAIREGLIQA